MSKTCLPYDPDQQCPRSAAAGGSARVAARPTIWPTSSPTWWTSWTCRQSPPATREKGGVAHLTILG